MAGSGVRMAMRMGVVSGADEDARDVDGVGK